VAVGAACASSDGIQMQIDLVAAMCRRESARRTERAGALHFRYWGIFAHRRVASHRSPQLAKQLRYLTSTTCFLSGARRCRGGGRCGSGRRVFLPLRSRFACASEQCSVNARTQQTQPTAAVSTGTVSPSYSSIATACPLSCASLPAPRV
jgi:hypothetical protein